MPKFKSLGGTTKTLPQNCMPYIYVQFLGKKGEKFSPRENIKF